MPKTSPATNTDWSMGTSTDVVQIDNLLAIIRQKLGFTTANSNVDSRTKQICLIIESENPARTDEAWASAFDTLGVKPVNAQFFAPEAYAKPLPSPAAAALIQGLVKKTNFCGEIFLDHNNAKILSDQGEQVLRKFAGQIKAYEAVHTRFF